MTRWGKQVISFNGSPGLPPGKRQSWLVGNPEVIWLAVTGLVTASRHVGIDQRLWMYGPNQSPVDAGKKSVSWKLSGADSGRITDHPQRKYSIENSERALKCSAGFPEVDGKGAGDHARKSKKTAFFVRMLPEMFSALQTLR